MHADLDTLVMALYVTIDDLLGPRQAPAASPSSAMPSWSVWPSPRCCSAAAPSGAGCGSPASDSGICSPTCQRPRPTTAGCAGPRPLVALALGELAARAPSWWDKLRLVDSTPVPCAASRETVKRLGLAGHAGYGYCKSHHRYFWGFRLYVLAGPDGLPVAWCLATPKLGEREVVAAMLDHERARLRPGLVILGDKGFAGQEFEQLVAGYGAEAAAS